MFSFDFPPLTAGVLWGALLIFALRVLGVAISTLRVLVMMRGKKVAAFVAGFFEVLAYVIAIAEVVNNLDNVWNVLGIISRYQAQSIVEKIHDAGFGATVGWGHGRGGTVGMIVAVVHRKEADTLCAIAEKADPNAFITIEDARAVRRGYIHMGNQER